MNQSEQDIIIQVTGKLTNRARGIFTGYDGEFSSSGNYKDIAKLFGHVLVEVVGGSYQGDMWFLIENRGKYGFLNVGYGSCSGCDALQACSSFDEANVLIESMENGIQWFNSLKEAQDYISNEDRKTSYFYYEQEWPEFVKKVLEVA